MQQLSSMEVSSKSNKLPLKNQRNAKEKCRILYLTYSSLSITIICHLLSMWESLWKSVRKDMTSLIKYYGNSGMNGKLRIQ